MSLTYTQRKELMPRGAQKQIAIKREVAPSEVSKAMMGLARPQSKQTKAKLRTLQSDIAKKIGLGLEEVFSPEELEASRPPAIPTAATL